MPSPAELFFSLFFSLIGAALFLYGKRSAHIPHILLGIALGGYPYFVPNIWLLCLIGVGLCIAAYLLRE